MSSEAALDQLSQFIIFLSAQLDNHSRKLLCKPKYGGGREEGGGGEKIFPMKTVFICSLGSAFWWKKTPMFAGKY